MDYTARLLLQKPDPDPITGDFVDISVLNANFDAIDAALGFRPVPSGSLPGAPYQGQPILETDTGKARIWGGSAYKQLLLAGAAFDSNVGLGTAPDANLARRIKTMWSGTNGSLSHVLLEQSGTAAGSRALSLKAGGEANERWWVDFDGKMQWGPGTAGGDTTLYRDAVNRLRTDDTFSANAYQINGVAARVQTQFYDLALAGTDGASQFLKTTTTDCVGLVQGFTTIKANALAVVTFVGDFETRVSSAGTGVILLNIDGVDLSTPQALFNGGNTTAGARSTNAQQAFITLTSAGSHTIKVRCRQAVGASDNMRLNNGHTTLNIQIFE